MHAGVVATHRVAMDTSLLCLKCSGPLLSYKAPVPKFINYIGDEFNNLSINNFVGYFASLSKACLGVVKEIVRIWLHYSKTFRS